MVVLFVFLWLLCFVFVLSLLLFGWLVFVCVCCCFVVVVVVGCFVLLVFVFVCCCCCFFGGLCACVCARARVCVCVCVCLFLLLFLVKFTNIPCPLRCITFLFWKLGRKFPCHIGDSNPRQYCTWLFSRTLYPLSYPCPYEFSHSWKGRGEGGYLRRLQFVAFETTAVCGV